MGATPAPTGPALPPVANLRDIGGHPVLGGGSVHTGLLFRSTDLAGLDADGVERVRRLGIRTVYDLRTRDEREAHPDRLPDGARSVVADVLAGVPPEGSPFHLMTMMRDTAAVTAVLADGGAVRFFEERYREFVELDSAREGYGLMFRDLAADGSRPGLVHCTTGKDRTGWAVAALLLLLGVPEDLVMAEYLASNAVMEGVFAAELEAFRARGGDPELLRPLIGVREAYLETALATMRRRFGDVESYFEVGLGVDGPTRLALREAFVERA
jgi:protein-tyrosine phosphatase